MAQPVWVLSVDLQTKTATFQSGMAEAAKSARGSFNEIKSASGEAAEAIGKHSTDVRHTLGLVDNVLRGDHMRAFVDVIRIYQNSALVMGALPFAAVAGGFALIAGIIAGAAIKMHEWQVEQEKLKRSMVDLDTAGQQAFNHVRDQILEASKRAAELHHNYLEALRIELELIDHQSMDELAHQFEALDKEASKVFEHLQSHWYDIGIGADGASHALEDFRSKYENLMANGKSGEAGDLLKGTLGSAKEVLAAMEQLKSAWANPNSSGSYNQAEKSISLLKSKGLSIATDAALDKEQAGQEALVKTLQQQLDITGEISTLKQKDQENARTQTHNTMGSDAGRKNAALIEAAQKMAEETIRMDKETYEKELAVIQGGEREKIDATRQGSAQRLAAIDSAMAEERAVMGDDTSFYRDLAAQRVQVQRQMGEEVAAQAVEAQKEATDNQDKMRSLQLVALRAHLDAYNSTHRVSGQQRAQESVAMSELEYQNKLQAFQRDEQSLDKNGNDYENKLKALQDKERQLTQQHEDDITRIKEQAAAERNERVLAAEQQFNDAIARGLTQSIMGHESWAKMISSLENQVVSGMMENAIKSVLADDFTKERDAASAARMAFNAGMKFPFPANLVAAPVLAAGAFASVMAFQSGTDEVPGVDRGDKVPAMLEPGEGVVPGGVMDGLSHMARSGNMNNGQHTTHLHYQPTYHVQTIDSSGIRDMLDKHEDQFTAHFQSTLRKMNR